MLRHWLLALTLVIGAAGQAHAYTDYTTINTPLGGPSLSSDSSTKRAGIRCYMQQWAPPFVSLSYYCGADTCTYEIPGDSEWRAKNCVTNFDTSRTCEIWRQEPGTDVRNGHMVYQNNGNTVWYYYEGQPTNGSQRAKFECDISLHRLRQFF